MQNGSFILAPPPPDSNEESNPHDRRNSARSLTTTQSQSELPDDALSHRASISTTDDSPQSWDGDSPDYNEMKIHSQLSALPNSLSQNPPPASAAVPPPPPPSAKPFAFGLFAAQHHPGSHHHHYNHHPDMDVIPKIEELDEEDDLENNIPNNTDHHQQQHHQPGAPVHVPRKRGRPRKHPLPVAGGGQIKITKGRSKTGCITCRRRKKKCDETKPAYVQLLPAPCLTAFSSRLTISLSLPPDRCQNCQKNAVVCEGYPPKEIWKSGKQKLEDGWFLSLPKFKKNKIFY